ncbi:MAG: arginine--tRNA ligase [Treponema sp.]|jgi:arginyl-tRNA synthetase|nr:arginine--tRNA ligase [Treponema sp.]
MYDYKEPWKVIIAESITALIKEVDPDAQALCASQIPCEKPPSPEMGDLGFPMFAFAKTLRKGPPQIAQIVAEKLAKSSGEIDGIVQAQGPYVNVRLDRPSVVKPILEEIFKNVSIKDNTKDCFTFGRPKTLEGKRVMVEFSSPNTNKPLHLGHLRNDVLGESISRIFAACGAQVFKVCIINDRGIHICKSMLAYKENAQGKTPQSEGIKSDRFVGDWYVQFSKALKEEAEALVASGIEKEKAEAQTQLMAKAQDLLRKWEAGDPETTQLWKTMNAWAIDGMKETYKRTGVSFDKYYFESETYMLGKDEVMKGLESGVFFRQEDGALAVDLSAEKLDKKILLRADGTSIYITQDLGTAISRHKDWEFDQMIYVVGSEQQYHFKVLFILLEKLGYPWAKNLFHLSYGMVNLPEGKMKSREGTVVDADDLIDNLRDIALAEIREKERESEVGNAAETAEKIALGALHYFLLQVNPLKDMLFDPKESLSFNGNTGPYLQYMGARICSMLRKSGRDLGSGELGVGSREGVGLMVSDPEWELVKVLAGYPQAVSEAAAGIDPSHLTGYLYELSKCFSRFYHECPILTCEDKSLSAARLELSRAVMLVLRDAFELVCIPFLEVM